MEALLVTAFGREDVLDWCEVPEPTPEAGEVVVDVSAVAVDWADVIKREAKYPGGPDPPFVSGHNLVGRVASVGPGVEDLTPGMRVFGAVPDRGVAADRVAVAARLLHPAPANLSDAEVAGLAGSYFTAHLAVTTFGRLQPGEAVLVHAGAGAFGSAAVQLARASGARLLAATAGGPAKVAALREAGVDVAIDYREQDFVAEVQAVTGGAGVDLVIESVGGDVLGGSFDCLRPLGRLVSVGASSGRSSDRFRLHTLFERSISVSGFSLGHLLRHRPEAVADAAARVRAAAEQGSIRPLVSQVFGRREAREAHRYLQSRQSIGRVVISLA